jgi:thioredoxin-like negative regulator of GroEL
MQTVNEENFQRLVREESENPVIVVFQAPWCNPCKQYKENAVLPYQQQNYKDFNFYELDIDMCPELVKEFNVRSIPTTALFVDGMIREIHTGTMTKNDLRLWIQDNV